MTKVLIGDKTIQKSFLSVKGAHRKILNQGLVRHTLTPFIPKLQLADQVQLHCPPSEVAPHYHYTKKHVNILACSFQILCWRSLGKRKEAAKGCDLRIEHIHF